MKSILGTLLLGAVVAGVIYYLMDEEGAKEVFGKVKDAATDAYDQMSDQVGKVQDKVNGALS